MTPVARAEHNAEGLHDPYSAVIHVHDELDPPEVADTLIHEVLHALWRNAALPKDDEEQIVTLLAHGLIQAFRDNRDLLSYLGAMTE